MKPHPTAYWLGFTLQWFPSRGIAKRYRRRSIDAMRAGEIPANSVGPLQSVSRDEAATMAAPFNPGGAWQ